MLPGIKVEINSVATNVTTTATTNDEGRFSASPTARRLSVTAEKTGFKRFVRTGVEFASARPSNERHIRLVKSPTRSRSPLRHRCSTRQVFAWSSDDERRVKNAALFRQPMELTLIPLVSSTQRYAIAQSGSIMRPAVLLDGNGQYNNDSQLTASE